MKIRKTWPETFLKIKSEVKLAKKRCLEAAGKA
jgi:hypothetical protein